MLDKTKAIISLIVAIAVLVGYIVKLEHRLTVAEQRNEQLSSELCIRLESIDDNQRRIMQVMFFNQVE